MIPLDKYIVAAAGYAIKATCRRSKCGAVIVHNDEIIGAGFNSPPGYLVSQCRCSTSKDQYNIKVTDKTCCMHAEQRAILNALSRHPDKVHSSRLYFVRLDDFDVIQPSGQPYCTICSKMALDVGISEFVLYHSDGIQIYDTEDYNNLSYQYEAK